MSICNESKLFMDKGRVCRSGLPTEAALKVLVEKFGAYDPDFNTNRKPFASAVEQYNDFVNGEFDKLATLEFSRDRKSMSILVKPKNGEKNLMFIKGAPDYLLERTNKIVNTNGEVV